MLEFALGGFAAVYTLWIFYLAVMNLMRARDAGSLSKTALVMGAPIVLTGVVLDFLVNVFVMTILMLELPRETLVTKRLQRHVAGPDTWRKKMAAFICTKFLDVFDPSGCHCD